MRTRLGGAAVGGVAMYTKGYNDSTESATIYPRDCTASARARLERVHENGSPLVNIHALYIIRDWACHLGHDEPHIAASEVENCGPSPYFGMGDGLAK